MNLKAGISYLIFGIILVGSLKGQVRYDTSILRTKPCTVKKVTMLYTTSVQVEDVKGQCNLELKWPIFDQFENLSNHNPLNSNFKEIAFDLLENKSPEQFCKRGIEKAFTSFTIKRFDRNFLSISFGHTLFPIMGTGGGSRLAATTNYDFNKGKIIPFWDLFKPNLKKKKIHDQLKRLINSKKDDDWKGRRLILDSEYFLNLKKELVLFVHPPAPGHHYHESLKIQKRNLKEYLKEGYCCKY